MRDAFGGLVNLVIIVVFMVIVSGYLAFNVSYTKAFKVKNKIISTFEQYEGNPDNAECMNVIVSYMKSVGYDTSNTPTMPSSAECDMSHSKCTNGFCYCRINEGSSDAFHYKIVTQITLDIPIINKVMAGMNTFQVTGDTKTIRTKEWK